MQTQIEASTGTVVGVDGGVYRVRIGERELTCSLRGRLKKERQRVSSLLVVGDQVGVTPLDDATGVIERVCARRNKLSRPGFKGMEQVIAANVDLLAIVASAAQPRFNVNLVDRFLVHAVRGGIPALVVLTKCDLEGPEQVGEWLAALADRDVAAIGTSTRSGHGLDELRKRLAGGLTVLSGHSGVGKSSLVNALVPDAQVRTRTTSVVDKGRHTTTASRCYDLDGGGVLVDTPGIRSLGMWQSEPEDVAPVFPEIDELALSCRFRDCRHAVEPGCAVRAAVEQGALEGARVKSFQRVHGR